MDDITLLIADYSDSITGCWLECFDWRRVRIKPMRLKIEGVVTATVTPSAERRRPMSKSERR